MSTSERASNEAMFYTRQGSKVRCGLCPHSCLIGDSRRGLCGVRENRGGVLHSLIYRKASSVHPDPIEKKPLFHFLPGSTSISFASVGCNLFCQHCQNYSLSRARVEDHNLIELTPEDVVMYARKSNSKSVSWTYNEPTIWHEFTTEASKAAHDAGLKTVYVTNGFIQAEPLKQLKGVIDAMNIDVKAFRESFYRKICGGRLAPVLRSCELAVQLGIHVELTYLIIPGENDSENEMGEFCKWVVKSLRPNVPVHFSAFHPDYKMTAVPSTPASTMKIAYDVGKKAGLEFVYLGNIYAGDRDDTFCPKCGSLVVAREGFHVSQVDLKENKCGKCGADINLVI